MVMTPGSCILQSGFNKFGNMLALSSQSLPSVFLVLINLGVSGMTLAFLAKAAVGPTCCGQHKKAVSLCSPSWRLSITVTSNWQCNCLISFSSEPEVHVALQALIDLWEMRVVAQCENGKRGRQPRGTSWPLETPTSAFSILFAQLNGMSAWWESVRGR